MDSVGLILSGHWKVLFQRVKWSRFEKCRFILRLRRSQSVSVKIAPPSSIHTKSYKALYILCTWSRVFIAFQNIPDLHVLIDCFTLLLAPNLADVSCYIGPPCPLESVWKSIQKSCRKGRRNRHMIREFLGNSTSIYSLTNHISVSISQSQTLIETFWAATNGPNKRRH